MNILITNDDGLEAEGLQRLVRALHEVTGAKLYVCAPDGQRSATAHGITMNKPITVEEAEMDNVEIAWQISGLPADCVKIAREFLRRKGVSIDIVYSGINHGGNLGTDTLYSGTVSAALEGSLCGFPSVAVSVDSHQAEQFGYACELAVNAAKAIQRQLEAGTADHRVVLNINTPNLPKEEIKGLRYTRLGPREYDEIFVPAHLDSDEELLKREAARAAAKSGEIAAKSGEAGAKSGEIAANKEDALTAAAEAYRNREAARAAGGREAGAASAEVIEEVRKMGEVTLPGSFRYSGSPIHYHDLPGDYDVVANQDGFASITPIHTDLTYYHMIEKIQDWELE